MVLIIGVIVAAFTHYIFGGLQFQARTRRTTSAARLHLSILLAAIVLVRAASYWLERYSLTTKSTDLMTGIQYTDANAVLPTKAILAIASIMCALMFLSVIWTKSWRLPIVGVVLLLVVSVVVGGIFPALIQSLRVKPSEKSFETPYIQNNINATRDAFGLVQRRRPSSTTPRRRLPRASYATTRRRCPASASSTPTSSRPPTSSCRRARATTSSPTPSTSTATTSTG